MVEGLVEDEEALFEKPCLNSTKSLMLIDEIQMGRE